MIRRILVIPFMLLGMSLLVFLLLFIKPGSAAFATSGQIINPDQIAALEKELRSHIETSDKMNRTTDKRGLVLAGADRVMREMTAIFKDDPQFAEPIENAMNAVWAKIYSEVTQ